MRLECVGLLELCAAACYCVYTTPALAGWVKVTTAADLPRLPGCRHHLPCMCSSQDINPPVALTCLPTYLNTYPSLAAQHRYRLVRLVCPVLRVVLSLLGGAPGSAKMAAEALDFCRGQHKLLARLLKEAAAPGVWRAGCLCVCSC